MRRRRLIVVFAVLVVAGVLASDLGSAPAQPTPSGRKQPDDEVIDIKLNGLSVDDLKRQLADRAKGRSLAALKKWLESNQIRPFESANADGSRSGDTPIYRMVGLARKDFGQYIYVTFTTSQVKPGFFEGVTHVTFVIDAKDKVAGFHARTESL